MVIDLEPLGTGMSAMAKLVYGSPPCVRIDDGKMVYLGGPVPVRDTAAERRMLESLRSALDLLPGRRMHFEGPDLAAFVGKLKRWRGDLAGTGASRIGADVRLEPRLRVSSAPTPDGLGADVSFDLTFDIVGEGERAAPPLGPSTPPPSSGPGRMGSASSPSRAVGGPRCRPAG